MAFVLTPDTSNTDYRTFIYEYYLNVLFFFFFFFFFFFNFFIIEVYASQMMALAGVELEALVSEPDALTTRPPPCAQ